MKKLILILLLATPLVAQSQHVSEGDFQAKALTDMHTWDRYLGQFRGLLYDNSNTLSGTNNSYLSAQNTRATTAAGAVQKLNTSGSPSSSGYIVLLTIGYSNTRYYWCTATADGYQVSSYTSTAPGTCDAGSFAATLVTGNSNAPNFASSSVIIIDGAQGSIPSSGWSPPNVTPYTNVGTYLGYVNKITGCCTASQVEVLWIDAVDGPIGTNMFSTATLPSTSADAYTLEANLGNEIRSAMYNYPNTKLAFISPREYGGGCAMAKRNPGPGCANPEPFAYEGGFSVKWAINAQIRQMATQVAGSITGNGTTSTFTISSGTFPPQYLSTSHIQIAGAGSANTCSITTSSATCAGTTISSLTTTTFQYSSSYSGTTTGYASVIGFTHDGYFDSNAGGLESTNGTAPVILWGPYYWESGVTARADGLVTACTDFITDGTHPVTGGASCSVNSTGCSAGYPSGVINFWLAASSSQCSDAGGQAYIGGGGSGGSGYMMKWWFGHNTASPYTAPWGCTGGSC